MGVTSSRTKPDNFSVKDGSAWELKDKPAIPKTQDNNSNGIRLKQFKAQVASDINKQKVTKDQLRRLSRELTRTAWYLGRRLDLGEQKVQRLMRNFSTEQETKYQILLCWRRQSSLKATIQNLVILLDQAGCEPEEYTALMTSSGFGNKVVVYDKPAENKNDRTAYKSAGELFHSDNLGDETVKKQHAKKHHRQSEYIGNNFHEFANNHKSSNYSGANQNLNKQRSLSTPHISVTWNKPQKDYLRSVRDNLRMQEGRTKNDVSCRLPSENASTLQVIDVDSITPRVEYTNGNCTDDSGIFTLSPPANDMRKAGRYQRSNSSTNGSKSRLYQEYRTSRRSRTDFLPSDILKQKNNQLRETDFNSTEELTRIFNNSQQQFPSKTYKLYHNNTKRIAKKFESVTAIPNENSSPMTHNSAREIYFPRNNFQTNTLPHNYVVGVIPGYNGRMPSHTSLTSIGSHDVINGKYVTVHEEEYVYCPQTRYNCVKFGGRGRMPSRFRGLISGMDIFPNGDIIASDGDNKRIQIFERNGKFKHAFDTNSELKPKGICLTIETAQKVAVCCGDRVNIYDMGGRIVNTFGQGIFRNNCYSICCDVNGNFYVTDIVGHTLSVHDKHGKIRKRFGYKGSDMINFNQPVAVVINDKNQMYISDSQNHCIKVYTLAGRPLFHIGAKGAADGLFWNPLGLCLDVKGNLLVADCGNNRISEFTPEGDFVRHLLSDEDGLRMPSLIRATPRGQLIVCEWEKQHIKIFTLETEV